MRHLVRKWTKIPTCVGIGPTKTLAKIANKVAKKYTEHDGVFVITDEAIRRDVLSRFDVADVWGIGRQHLKRLHQDGVRTALQLSEKPDWWVKGHFSVVGERLVRELRGEACIPMLEPRATSKNICTSRSFGVMLNSVELVREAVANFANRIGEKLREQQACARVLTVFIHTNSFREDLPQYYNSISMNLPVATNSSSELMKYALAGLESIYKTGHLYKKAGVIVTGIVPAGQVQGHLFSGVDRAKEAKVLAVMDRLNAKFGRNTVNFAVQGKEKAFWHPKFEKRTPRYTTQWKELPRMELD
ncbi:MAG: DUF4113 domain-containing protein [Cytophagaceae bacterium]|nr:DUF4113 domain-containing protein [Cytophagaceae bacterium]